MLICVMKTVFIADTSFHSLYLAQLVASNLKCQNQVYREKKQRVRDRERKEIKGVELEAGGKVSRW